MKRDLGLANPISSGDNRAKHLFQLELLNGGRISIDKRASVQVSVPIEYLGTPIRHKQTAYSAVAMSVISDAVNL
jgi:hypothetical protein